jgi:hypothetical protein
MIEPISVLAADPDRIEIRSRWPIQSVRLDGLTEWSSFFVVYRDGSRTAVLLVRTNQTPLTVVVELQAIEGMRVTVHRVCMNNPWPYSQRRE